MTARQNIVNKSIVSYLQTCIYTFTKQNTMMYWFQNRSGCFICFQRISLPGSVLYCKDFKCNCTDLICKSKLVLRVAASQTRLIFTLSQCGVPSTHNVYVFNLFHILLALGYSIIAPGKIACRAPMLGLCKLLAQRS